MNWVQNPVRPSAMIPGSSEAMISTPTNVPIIVPRPPNTEVPPMNTAARVVSR